MQSTFQEYEVLKRLKHYLPHQSPLKDFVHHNTLGAFQEYPFVEAISRASCIFGYKTSLNITEYRALYKANRIREDILEQVIIQRKGSENADEWISNLFNTQYDNSIHSRLSHFRSTWKTLHGIDLDFEINGLLFKFLGSYLDQGIAQWHFPFEEAGFLASVRNLEKTSVSDFVHSKLAMRLLMTEDVSITELLTLIVGDECLFENYLFEQQFSHPGWSGMVAMVEKHPETLLDKRKISLEDVIKLELILEIDLLEKKRKGKWKPFAEYNFENPVYVFDPTPLSTKDQAIALWQEAYEWSYFDSVLAGIQKQKGKSHKKVEKSFQALFCIDDREGSIRRHIEKFDPKCETYGTPGHFGIPMYYQSKDGLFLTKVCPVPVQPKHLVRELGDSTKLEKEVHFSSLSQNPFFGFFYALVLGFWSGLKMFLTIFKPSFSTMASSSFSHMGKKSKLSVEYDADQQNHESLQVGFKVEEMANIVASVLKSIGLIDDFGKIVYCIGHGASSINNTHYAGYDCGACSGRPGSVNARAIAYMANHSEVRILLKQQDIKIPEDTVFVGGLHDTTRDEFEFYDEDNLNEANNAFHFENKKIFVKALDMNAKERSRRFFSINSKQSAEKIHELVRNRSVSLFEPRPELNHATNALAIVGRHSLNEGLFLDRRAFSNSYDYSLDPNGDLLLGILNAAAPVCGGINLEYYFSRVDNQKLGAGSKLPHNVVGLIGVVNGVEGDLRPGLPLQMIEVHDPIRLMLIVEHYPEVVLETIQKNKATYQWFLNEWVILTAIHPETLASYRYENGAFTLYTPLKKLLDTVVDVDALVESHDQNLPVYLINSK